MTYVGHDVGAPPRELLDGRELVRELLVGYQVTQALYVAARLSIAELLRDGPMTLIEVAEATGTDHDTLEFLLGVLSSYGVFTKVSPQAYANNSASAFLDAGRPDSLLPTIVATGKERYDTWSGLLSTVRTGTPSFAKRFGAELHAFYAEHPAAATPFNGAMAALTTPMVHELSESYDFASHSIVVEVGGGVGVFMAHLLRTFPALKGVLVDLPHVVAEARRELRSGNFGSRLLLAPGDARKQVPVNGDLYLIKMVLCDFGDSDAIEILRSCRKGITEDGRLVIFDKIRNEKLDPISRRTLMSALNLLVMTGGRERSTEEYRRILAMSDFDMVDVMRTSALDGEIHRIVAIPK